MKKLIFFLALIFITRFLYAQVDPNIVLGQVFIGMESVNNNTIVKHTLSTVNKVWLRNEENGMYYIDNSGSYDNAVEHTQGNYENSKAVFNFAWKSNGNMGLSIYKVTNDYNSSYFYLDCRDNNWADLTDGNPDLYYFVQNVDSIKYFTKGNLPVMKIEDGDVIRPFQLLGYNYKTDKLVDFWANVLSIVPSKNEKPLLIFGKHPTFNATHYKIYRAISRYPRPIRFLNFTLIQTLNNNVYEFEDNEVTIGTNDYYVYYYVIAYNQNNNTYSERSNIENIQGSFTPNQSNYNTFPYITSIHKIDENRFLFSEVYQYDKGFLGVYNTQTEEIENIWNLSEMFDTNYYVTFSTVDNVGNYLVFFANKLYEFSNGTWTSADLPVTNYVSYGNIFVDSNNDIWIGLYSPEKLLKKEGNTVIDLSYPNGLPISGGVGKISQFNDSLWIPTSAGYGNTGLALFHNNEFQVFNTNNTEFETNAIYCLFKDSNGNYWVGTADDGLYKWNINSGTITKYNIDNSELTSNFINTIVEDQNGVIWVGTDDWFAKIENDVLQKAGLFVGNSVPIYSIFPANNGDLYIGTYGYGLLKYDGTNYQEITAINNDNEVITTSNFLLLQNYPNPFNPVTTIKYSIPANAGVETQNPHGVLRIASLRIYNILGKEVATLVNQRQAPGNYSVQFNASNLPSGVYFYTLRVGDFTVTKKMLLLK